MPKYYSAKLSAADQVAPISHTAVLGGFSSHDPEWAGRQFAAGIKELCRQLPWLSGFISRGDQGYTHLTWRDDGQIHFEVRKAHHLPPYAELVKRGMKLHEVPYDFRPTGMTTREDKESPIDFVAPAMLWSMTILKGGFILAYATHHHLCDGTQAIILNILHEIMSKRPAKHVRDPLQPLTRYDTILNSLQLEDPKRSKGDKHGELQEHELPEVVKSLVLGANGNTPARVVPKDDQSVGKGNRITNEIFSFPVETLKKARIAFDDQTGNGKPTTVLFIIALFWHLITAVREKRGSVLQPPPSNDADVLPTPKTTMVFPVSARPVFKEHVDLTETKYIGNLISGGLATSETTLVAAGPEKPGDLPQGLVEAVELLTGAAFTGLDPDWIKARLNLVLKVPDARILVQPNTLSGNDLLASSWSHLEMYCDFGPGVGTPDFIRPAANKIARTNRPWFSYVIMLETHMTPEGIEVLDVFSCFDADDMAELKRQPLLQKFLSTDGLNKAKL